MPPFLSNKKSKRRIYAGYVQDELEIAKRVTLSAGLRLRLHRGERARICWDGRPLRDTTFDHDFWSPKIAGIVWRFRSDASAYFSYARGFRLPNIDEAFGFFGFNEDTRARALRQVTRSVSSCAASRFTSTSRSTTWTSRTRFCSTTRSIGFDAFGLFAPTRRSVNIDRVRHRGHRGLDPHLPLELGRKLRASSPSGSGPRGLARDLRQLHLRGQRDPARQGGSPSGRVRVRPSLEGKRLPITRSTAATSA